MPGRRRRAADGRRGNLPAHRRVGRRRARCARPSRSSWSGRRGSTTSASRPEHVVFIESPTDASGRGPGGRERRALRVGARRRRMDRAWCPAAGDGSRVRWFRLDPCLVTHVLGAYDEPGDARHGDADGAIVLYVCRYEVPETGSPSTSSASVVGPAGLGLRAIGGGLGVLERWRIAGERRRADPGRRPASWSIRGLGRRCARVPVPLRLLRRSWPGTLRTAAPMRRSTPSAC